jgi:hypothetical protein
MNKKDKTSPTEEKKKGNIKGRRSDEIAEQALQERQLLTGLLIHGADQRAEAEASKRRRNAQEIELLSGKKITINQIEDMVTALRQPYTPMFGTTVSFFREMYRLLDWTDKDPDKFTKPAIVGEYINQIIYARFHKDVQPTLQALAVPGGIRRDKFFQYLTIEGQQKLEQYRDEAIAMMKQCATWYEFRVKHGRSHQLPVQKKMFEIYKG